MVVLARYIHSPFLYMVLDGFGNTCGQRLWSAQHPKSTAIKGLGQKGLGHKPSINQTTVPFFQEAGDHCIEHVEKGIEILK
jgi:hypothetical protein